MEDIQSLCLHSKADHSHQTRSVPVTTLKLDILKGRVVFLVLRLGKSPTRVEDTGRLWGRPATSGHNASSIASRVETGVWEPIYDWENPRQVPLSYRTTSSRSQNLSLSGLKIRVETVTVRYSGSRLMSFLWVVPIHFTPILLIYSILYISLIGSRISFPSCEHRRKYDFN